MNLFIGGYSRGAAIGGIIASKLLENCSYFNENNLCAVLFACPNYSKSDIVHDNVFIINNPADIVATVPLTKWGFRCEGVVVNLLLNKKIVNLINNPNLLEKEEFSALLLAIFHLCDELELREDFTKISKADFNHLKIDMDRVYSILVYEWVRYLRHLYKFHPYMLSIAIRINPFDKDASIYVDDE